RRAGRPRGRPPALLEPFLVLSLGSLIALSVPFLLLPTDPYYLLGALPFGIIGIVALARSAVIRPAAAAALLATLVLPSLITIGSLDIDAYRDRHEYRIRWAGPGRVLESRSARLEIMQHAAMASRAALPADSAVIVGSLIYPLQLLLGQPERSLQEKEFLLGKSDTLLLRILPRSRVESLLRERPVYYAAGENLPYLTRRIFGYSLEEIGARKLSLW
ncbi:MAG TPA: hypothetical protein VNI57_11600, partial [Candidatus Saccharimonadales bacterium]|nr:hypothetical protein [Candidatus Saccharimonadales bacterium]